MVQCLGLRASTVGGLGSIPGQGTEIAKAAKKKRHNQKGLLTSRRAGGGQEVSEDVLVR